MFAKGAFAGMGGDSLVLLIDAVVVIRRIPGMVFSQGSRSSSQFSGSGISGTWVICGAIEREVGEWGNSCLQSHHPSLLDGRRHVSEGWRGWVQPTLVVAWWVAGRRAEKGWTWKRSWDASLGKLTVTSGGYQIQGLGRWRGPSLTEEQSRRPSILMGLWKKG